MAATSPAASIVALSAAGADGTAEAAADGAEDDGDATSADGAVEPPAEEVLDEQAVIPTARIGASAAMTTAFFTFSPFSCCACRARAS